MSQFSWFVYMHSACTDRTHGDSQWLIAFQAQLFGTHILHAIMAVGHYFLSYIIYSCLHVCTSVIASNSFIHDLHAHLSLWAWRPSPTMSSSMCGWGSTWHNWVCQKAWPIESRDLQRSWPFSSALEGMFSHLSDSNDLVSCWRLDLQI